jgi:hypothetical protein
MLHEPPRGLERRRSRVAEPQRDRAPGLASGIEGASRLKNTGSGVTNDLHIEREVTDAAARIGEDSVGSHAGVQFAVACGWTPPGRG